MTRGDGIELKVLGKRTRKAPHDLGVYRINHDRLGDLVVVVVEIIPPGTDMGPEANLVMVYGKPNSLDENQLCTIFYSGMLLIGPKIINHTMWRDGYCEYLCDHEPIEGYVAIFRDFVYGLDPEPTIHIVNQYGEEITPPDGIDIENAPVYGLGNAATLCQYLEDL